MKEKLAELVHEQWSRWMKYIFNRCNEHNKIDGAMVIPEWEVDRWKRQLKTPYCELSESEKDSDRGPADKFLTIFNEQTKKIQDERNKYKDALGNIVNPGIDVYMKDLINIAKHALEKKKNEE